MSRGHCILSHGFESGPAATKVTALAQAAQQLGWSSECPDYTDLDARSDISRVGDVPARLQRLLQLAGQRAAEGPLVLAGSSLGAYISAIASLQLPVRGLFLMVPPLTMGPLPAPEPPQCEAMTPQAMAASEAISAMRMSAAPIASGIPTRFICRTAGPSRKSSRMASAIGRKKTRPA